MSRSSHNLTIRNFDRWERWLGNVEKTSLDKCKDRILRSGALRGLEYAQDLTPRRSSRLAQSLGMGRRDNYFKLKIGKSSFVAFGTNVEYAAAVEDGYTQRAGQFVPGYWSRDIFHYDPEADGGMVLTGKVIPGAHMFRKAMDHLEGDMPTITEFEFRRLYAELTGGS
jgi:hypothetical protein